MNQNTSTIPTTIPIDLTDCERDRLYINNHTINIDTNNTNTNPANHQLQPTNTTSTTNPNNTNIINTIPIISTNINVHNQMNIISNNDNNSDNNTTIASHNKEPLIAQQLLNAYLIDDEDKDITTMASILLQSLDSKTTSSNSPNNKNNQQPLFNFEPFMQLRSQQYTGTIEDCDQNLFNHRIFQAALYTNSPIIIDSIMPYINVDFTALHDRYMIEAIIDATRMGHYRSIVHLINNYHLSPIIPQQHRDPINLFYLSTSSNNPQLTEYLLPLCFNSTTSQDLHSSIYNIASHGHLYLIKTLKDEYNVDILHSCSPALNCAIRSNNIELIDYLIEVIGFDPNANDSQSLERAMYNYKWEVVKHLINKYHTPIRSNPIIYIIKDENITPDTFDSMIEILNIDMKSIAEPPLLFLFAAKNDNVVLLKHLINKYNADPHYLYNYHGNPVSLLNWTLQDKIDCIISKQFVEMIEYLCELGLDVNQRDDKGHTPIQLASQLLPNPNQSILPIFKTLLQHGAKIDNIYELIQNASKNQHWSTIQYLIETYQPHITDESKFINTNLLHCAVYSSEPSLEFILFLISLGIFDINGKNRQNKTPIQWAMSMIYNNNSYLDCLNIVGVIKLLIQNGANVTIDDWIMVFDRILLAPKYTHIFFEIFDYFKDTFGWDTDTYLTSNNTNSSSKIKPLLNYSPKCRTPPNSTTSITYRILLHRYKANVNEQHKKNQNTVLHHLSVHKRVQLLRFSLSHSHYKPNIYTINNKGETFLHSLIIPYKSFSQNDMVDKNATMENEFENLLDVIIDLVTK